MFTSLFACIYHCTSWPRCSHIFGKISSKLDHFPVFHPRRTKNADRAERLPVDGIRRRDQTAVIDGFYMFSVPIRT